MNAADRILRDIAEQHRQAKMREIRAQGLDAMDRAARGAFTAHTHGNVSVIPFGFTVTKEK